MAVFITLVVMGLLVGSFVLTFKRRKAWPLATATTLLVIYMFVQPSYLPKCEVKRSVIPQFDKSESEIVDRILKTKSGDEYDQKRNTLIKEGLPFKRH